MRRPHSQPARTTAAMAETSELGLTPSGKLPPLMQRMKAQMKLMMMMQKLKASGGGSAAAAADEWDEDQMEMLRGSYQELTGMPMPVWMKPPEALAELKRQLRFMPHPHFGDEHVFWKGVERHVHNEAVWRCDPAVRRDHDKWWTPPPERSAWGGGSARRLRNLLPG